MKKSLILILTILSLSVNAQEFNIGLSGALPVGDADQFTKFGINADVNLLWELSEQVDFGVTTGYHHYFGEDVIDPFVGNITLGNVGFIPLAVAGRINANKNIALGVDLGYAFSVTQSNSEGGFYYTPKIQYAINPLLDIVFAYKRISINRGGAFEAFSLGIEVGL